MLAFGTRAHATQRRRQVAARDLTVHKSEWMETGTDPQLSPTIFLVEQPPNSTVSPHFHRNNQFQVFVDGGGRIGKSTIAPVIVHYAGAYTGYGPLEAGPEGVKYFTIRPVYEAGANYVPEDRSAMVQGPKRHAVGGPIELCDASARWEMPRPRYDEIIPHAEDGLGAIAVTLPPASSPDVAWPPTALGVFVMVLSGSASHADGFLGEWETVFASTPQELPHLVAESAGAQLVFLCIPQKAGPYR